MQKETKDMVPYQPETAAEFYAAIADLHSHMGDAGLFYARMGSLFAHIVDEKVACSSITLVGMFAKVDFLLKQGHAKSVLVRQVNDLRVRLMALRRGELDEVSMHHFAADDLQALTLFVSFLYAEPVPPSLEAVFPVRRQRRKGKRLLGECMRVIVEDWDAEYITCLTEQDGVSPIRVCYASGNKAYPYDWSYLQPLLGKGTQLHLIRPRMLEGVVYPELIILEPDYLVDISQVARCMEEYGDSPLVYLLHQIEPAPQSEPLVLGNLASQMLDEELHHNGKDAEYQDTITTFFHRNALSLLTTPLSPGFHKDAMAQQRHIRQAIREDLPLHVGAFDASKVMVEPSFFSQMLGLQGRMDFLQLDHRLVIEQKSGSGAFVPNDPEPGVPKVQRTHYVQLLLYMAVLRYNYREQYEANNRELQAFLLYSKYPNALQGLSFAPELLFHSLRLRNQLVWHQLRLSEGGFEVLGSITPERMNTKGMCNRLWQQYKQPQIEALLAPIHSATPLELAYYYRMLAFVAKEHTLSKLGNQTKENSGFASIWLESLDEKLAAGNIYHQLTLLSPCEGDSGKVEQVALQPGEMAQQGGDFADMSNFRVGDIVILYSYRPDAIPDATCSMVFRCSILSISNDQIVLSLRQAQVDAYVFLRHSDRLWAIEHDFFESSSSSLFRGLHAFLSAPRERRDMLMLQRQPRVDTSMQLKGDYGSFNEMSRRVLQARELFLIIGPPGTGKTSFGLLNTLREELLHEGSSVLVMSYTNRAVDEICSKLTGTVDYIRLGNKYVCPPQYLPYTLDERITTCRNTHSLMSLLEQQRVVVGTTTALNSCLQLFRKKKFSLAIIDEASQILEPHLVGLFSAMHGSEPAISKFVLIGDHKQLPAVVQQREDESAVESPLLHEIGLRNCRYSLFERLLHRYGKDPSVTYMLTHQGRMHREIADFPNRMFYDGRLQVVPLPHQVAELKCDSVSDDYVTRLLQTQRVFFLPSPLPADSPSDKVNLPEAEMIADIVKKIYMLEPDFKPDETVGVIVPYRNQIATIRSAIERAGIPELSRITIDTVERYQGSQRRYIIYGFTIQKHYQLRFLTSNTFLEDGRLIDRKLNVAMTRAQEHLILIGNPALLDLNPLFRQLYTTFLASPER